MSRQLSFLAAGFATLAWLVSPAAHGETYTQVSSSLNHTCAIYGSGGLHCWGSNFKGQLGDGTTTDSAIPVAVPGLTGVTSVSAGWRHTCALTQGLVKCWGDGSDGQLGNGTTNSSPTPIAVVGLSTVSNQAVAVAAGANFTCAHMQNVVTGASTVRCWGSNTDGQVGSGSASANVFAPATVSGLTGVSHLSVGTFHACVVTGGTVRCWGSGTSGQLGNGGLVSSNVPAAAATGITNATMVTAGGAHVCAANGTTGDAWCWGRRNSGQIGDGSLLNINPMATPYYFGVSFRPTKIFAGNEFTCAIVSGQAFCWGYNADGQLGSLTQPTANSGSPLPVTSLTSGVATMAGGRDHACAITTGGALTCWGYNGSGQRGSLPLSVYPETGTPQSRAVAGVKCSLDLDGDGQVLATTDAVLMARAALGYSGAALTGGALAAAAPRRTSVDILSYLAESCGLVRP